MTADMQRIGISSIFDRKTTPFYGGLIEPEEKRKHVLVVDNDLKFCEAAEMALNLAGFETSFASSGEEAFSAILKATESGYCYDLIMLDICAPVSKISGAELLKKMKSMEIDLPVLTTDSLPHDSEYKGALEYLGRPFSARELIKRVKSMLLLYRYHSHL